MEAIAKKNGHIPDRQMKAYGITNDADMLKILHEASVTTYVRPGLPVLVSWSMAPPMKKPLRFFHRGPKSV